MVATCPRPSTLIQITGIGSSRRSSSRSWISRSITRSGAKAMIRIMGGGACGSPIRVPGAVPGGARRLRRLGLLRSTPAAWTKHPSWIGAARFAAVRAGHYPPHVPVIQIEDPRPAPRRRTVVCRVGSVPMGGGHPVVVQSMTNTSTEDPAATAEQIRVLAEAGSEIVRITVNTREAARAVPEIRRRLLDLGVTAPVVGDFHYNGHLLLAEFPDCARDLDKYRINPGNVGVGEQHDENFKRMIEAAREHGKPVRIGVNWGSLDRALLTRLMDENARSSEPREDREVVLAAMRESALRSAELAERFGQPHEAIVLSAKVSGVADLIAIYRALSRACDYPLHLGLTEAGMGTPGIVASSAALAILIAEGIGDTIRVSLTPEPGGDRAEEVRVCQHVLQALGVRHFSP